VQRATFGLAGESLAARVAATFATVGR